MVQRRNKDPEINLNKVGTDFMMDNDYIKLWKSGNVVFKVEGEVINV